MNVRMKRQAMTNGVYSHGTERGKPKYEVSDYFGVWPVSTIRIHSNLYVQMQQGSWKALCMIFKHLPHRFLLN